MKSTLRCLILAIVLPGASTTAAAGGPPVLIREQAGPRPATVLDRLWIWTHPVGAHDGLDLGDGRKAKSRMTPVAGADFLGLSNLYFIHYPNNPPPAEFPAYALAFRPMRRVVLSLTGAGGDTSPEGRQTMIRLAREHPNVVGFVLDDFLHWGADSAREAADTTSPVPAPLSPAQLREIRHALSTGGRPLPVTCVIYTHQISPRILPHVNEIDRVAIWTWRSDDLKDLEANLERLERIVRPRPILLGCYLYDYGAGRPMSVERMKRQCELGLKWLQEGRIEGMIFLASNVCDLGLPSVQWTRDWIRSVKDQAVPDLPDSATAR
ncbi:MAG: hypothetical protein U0790_09705 [Isosphaeraceae bacterium]